MIKFNGTVSSGGKKTTTTTNEKIEFFDPHNIGDTVVLKKIQIESFNNSFSFFINNEYDTSTGEGTIHVLDVNSEILLEGIEVSSITIIESTVDYRFIGLF